MFSGDGFSLDPMFSGVSLQSLLSLNPSLFGDGYPNLPQPLEPPPNKLLVPKPESPQPFTFFPNHHPASFRRLPPLHSPEPDPKRHRLDSPVIPQSHLARQRRQKLSEKTRCLQKLMPWDKKMDQATLLEEAYKYVKFLQAQFRVLHSMPSHTAFPPPLQNAGVFGDLENLNRSQLLQVLVNSPVAQTMLYSQGFCVVSLEQLNLLRKLSQRTHHHHHHHHQQQQQQQHHVADPASNKTFFN